MELNHHIRLCRPFPFRFGFRALSHNVGIVTTAKQTLQQILGGILLVRLHEIPPPKESMKKARREPPLAKEHTAQIRICIPHHE